ncbi:MAG: RES domain-containing protein, partial [Mesorhizobium sp.]
LVWNSVRMPGGDCIGIFWPDVITIPVQGRHYSYHWDGSRVDFVRQHDTGKVLAVT